MTRTFNKRKPTDMERLQNKSLQVARGILVFMGVVISLIILA